MNPEFEAEAQRLSTELRANPEAAANGLRAELFRQPVREVQALAHEANRLVGPCSSHLVVRPLLGGQAEVQVVAPNCNPNPYYNNQIPPNYYGPGYGVPGYGSGYGPGYVQPGYGAPSAGVFLGMGRHRHR